MKSTPRILRNGSANQPQSQVSTAGVKPPSSLLKAGNHKVKHRPENSLAARADIAGRALDEFSTMQFQGNAAATLLVLMAANAKEQAECSAGWEKLRFPGFEEGLLDLSQAVIAHFQRTFDKVHCEVKALVAKLQNPNLPMPEETPLLGYSFEDAVDGLAHLVELLGIVCSACKNQGHQIDHAEPMRLASALQERFDGAFSAWKELLRVVKNQSAPLQAA